MFIQLQTTEVGLKRRQATLCGLRFGGVGDCCIARVEDESVQLCCTGALDSNWRYQKQLAGSGLISPTDSPSVHSVLDSTLA